MIYPLETELDALDARAAKRSATVTWGLVLTTTAISALALRGWNLERLLLERHGATPLALLGHAFLHANVPHLFGNMLGLLAFGAPIERLWGWRRLLGIYLAAVVAGGLAWLLFGDGLRAVGASGGVLGLAGTCLILIPRARVRLLVWLLGPLVALVHTGTAVLAGPTASSLASLACLILFTAQALRGWSEGTAEEGLLLRLMGFRSFTVAGIWLVLLMVSLDLVAVIRFSRDHVAHSAHLAGAGLGLLAGLLLPAPVSAEPAAVAPSLPARRTNRLETELARRVARPRDDFEAWRTRRLAGAGSGRFAS